MPNDDDLSKQIAQKRHADTLAFERMLMNETGLSRSQVRAQLHEGLQNVQTKVEAQRIVRAAEQPPPPPKIETSETKLEISKSPINTTPSAATGVEKGGESIALTPVTCSGNLNGSPAVRILYGP